MSTPIESIEILLVEDNPDDIMLIKTALEESNIPNKIIYLKDGAEAMDFIFHEGSYAQSPSDTQAKVIMLDLNMPKVSGLEVLRRIKKDENTKNIPIVVF